MTERPLSHQPSPYDSLPSRGEGRVGLPKDRRRDHRPRSSFTSLSDLRQRARDQRKRPTVAEAILWNVVRRRQLEGAKFRRQHPLGQFVVDFFCPEASLVVELDGDIHEIEEVADADLKRDRALRAHGLTVLRFTNAEVYTQLERVVDTIGESIVEHRRRRDGGR